MPDVIALLADLIAIPSVNPMGASETRPEFGEAQLADFIVRFLETHGIPTKRQEVYPGRDNILAYVAGRNKTPARLFETHMDTVAVEGMEIPPFEPIQREGRIYGRGSCDAKASLAAMMVALIEVSHSTPPTDVWLCAAVDEEYTFGGAAHLVQSGFRAEQVLVGEPTGLNIVTVHKGAARWRLTARGRAAHSAMPWEGENAIYKMARVVTALERYAMTLQRGPRHPRLGPRTLNVGTIEGGQTVNTVPDRCSVTVDRRVLPGEDLTEVMASLEPLLVEEGLAESIEIEELLRDPPMELPEDSPWTQQVLTLARRYIDAVTAAVHYGTDASKFAQAGMSAVVMGPGNIAQAHTACEWVDMEQVQMAATIYTALAQSPPHL